MAGKTSEPVRRIIVKFWEHAVERTEAEIEELKALDLFVRDATPEDKLAPHDEAEKSRAAAAAALASATPTATPATQVSATPAASVPAATAAKPRE